MPMTKLKIKFPKVSIENGTMQLNIMTIHTHTYKYANLDVKSIFVCIAKKIKLTATLNTNKIVNSIVRVV